MEKLPPAVGRTLQPGRAAMAHSSQASEPGAPVPGERGPAQLSPNHGPPAACKPVQDWRGEG